MPHAALSEAATSLDEALIANELDSHDVDFCEEELDEVLEGSEVDQTHDSRRACEGMSSQQDREHDWSLLSSSPGVAARDVAQVDQIVQAAQRDFESEAASRPRTGARAHLQGPTGCERMDLRQKRIFTIDPATAKDAL